MLVVAHRRTAWVAPFRRRLTATVGGRRSRSRRICGWRSEERAAKSTWSRVSTDSLMGEGDRGRDARFRTEEGAGRRRVDGCPSGKPSLGGGASQSPDLLKAASSQDADDCRAEAPISPQSGAPSSGHFVTSTRAIPGAAQQPAPLAAAQNVVQDRLPGRLLAQEVDLLGSAARAESATRYRFQDREFD